MKIYINGSTKILQIEFKVINELRELFLNEDEILITDADGVATEVQSYFNELAYDNLTVYTNNGYVERNYGKWEEKPVITPIGIYGKELEERIYSQMANDCDSAIMVWDKIDLDLLKYVKQVITLNKPCKVYLQNTNEQQLITNEQELLKFAQKFFQNI